ncbi:uncharacterized protein RAG0_06470 [Rhynchosporium agropyri]|uniref:N-acetyltransferase domain-containing protein n=1 Tax=Rhynchosporium agropyri TaxID=914238 RepID=A0A1E1KGY8_9HELO|nr:uncharacterized protein RAG0_06470 [Rhynchosporium agropyri]
MAATPKSSSTIRVEPITNPDDFTRCFAVAASAFGTQSADGIWTAVCPNWNTPEGAILGAERMRKRWETRTFDAAGNPNCVFLKATIPDPSSGDGKEVIAGMAIWVQVSMDKAYGDVPDPDWAKALHVEELYPGDEPSQRFLCQVFASLTKQRLEAIKQAATRDPPSLLGLDLCGVDPAYQRRGIAAELVKWGLEEARSRGGLEAVLEASKKGRGVYAKLGFRQEGEEIEYLLDDEFKERSMPSNVFMRTGILSKN